MSHAVAQQQAQIGNGVYLPKWAWGLIAGVLFLLGTAATGWLSYVSATQSSTREDVAEMRGQLKAISERLSRIEQTLDRLYERVGR